MRELPTGTVTFLFTDIEGQLGSSTSSVRTGTRKRLPGIVAWCAKHVSAMAASR